MVELETRLPQPNDDAFRKVLTVSDEIGSEEDCLLKKLIKRFSDRQKVKVSSISHVRIDVDGYFPNIRLRYLLNNEDEYAADVLEMYRVVRDSDESAKKMLKKLFEGQFIELQKDACKKLFPVLAYRVKTLQKDFKAELSNTDRAGFTNILAAVYTLVPNKTIQFLFIDIDYNYLSFNSFFIEKYQKRLGDAYKFYLNTFKPRLVRKQNEDGDEEEAVATRPHVGDEELSSDD